MAVSCGDICAILKRCHLATVPNGTVAILAQVRSAMWPALEAGSSAEDAMACARGRARASAALFDRWSKGRSAGVHLACASVMVGLLSTVGTAA